MSLSKSTLVILLLACCSGAARAQVSPGEKKEGFRSLFNGKNLDGWDGDPRIWKVRDGIIVGSTEGVPLEHNEFLISKQNYGNFVLRAEMKLRNHNSGIQFRSVALPDWVVQGYQFDMAENNYWGGLYEEKGKRGIMANGWKDKGEKVVRLKDWNDCEIFCDGDLIRLKLNGLQTVEIHDSLRLSGVIAFQVHRGPAMEVYIRNVRIKTLP
jgi:hypothetical protein